MTPEETNCGCDVHDCCGEHAVDNMTEETKIMEEWEEKFIRDSLEVMGGNLHATCACGTPHAFMIGSPEEHRDFLLSAMRRVREETLKEMAEDIQEIIQREEAIHGNQYEGKEREIFFEGFDDGRAMMRIDLVHLLANKEPK